MKKIIVCMLAIILAAPLVEAGYMKALFLYSDGERPLVPSKVKAWFLWKDRLYLDSVILTPADTAPGLGMPYQLLDSISTPYSDSVGWFTVNYLAIIGGDTVFASDPRSYIQKAGQIDDSVIIDMSSLNAVLDNDTTLASFLRAGIGGGFSSTLDSQTVARAVGAQLHDSAVAMLGTSRIWQLRGLQVIGTTGNDTAVIFKGFGSGPGLFAMGGASGSGVYARGGLTSGNAITAWTNNGHGMALYGSRANAGLYAEAIDSGQGAYFLGGNRLNGVGGAGTAYGIFIRGRADDAMQLTAGDSGSNKHALEAQGGHHAGGDAVRFLGHGTSGMGIRVTTESGIGLFAEGRGGNPGIKIDSGARMTIDTVVYVDSTRKAGSAGGVTGTTDTSAILALGMNHPNIFGSRNGVGLHAVSLCAYDSNHAQVVPGTRLAVRNLNQSALLALGATGTNGEVHLNLDTGRYVVSAIAPGYIFAAFDTILVDGPGVDTSFGYRFDPGSPNAPHLCRVYGFFSSIGGTPLEGVVVSAQLAGGVVRYDSIIVSPFQTGVTSDSLGYFHLDLIPSDSLNPSGSEYIISATYPAGTVLRKKLKIPGTTSWQLNW